MMQSKKILLGALAALLVLLAAGLAGAKALAGAQQAQADESQPAIDLAAFSPADIQAFGYTFGGESLSFEAVQQSAENSESGAGSQSGSDPQAQQAETVWRLADEPELELEQSLISTMLTALGNLTAQRQLGQPSEEYGLDQPTMTLWATANGETTTWLVGAENAVTGSVYLQKQGEDTVYLVAAGKLTALQKAKADLLAPDPTPQPTAEPESASASAGE